MGTCCKRSCQAPRNQDNMGIGSLTDGLFQLRKTTSHALSVQLCLIFGSVGSDQAEEGQTSILLSRLILQQVQDLDIKKLKRKLDLATKEKDKMDLFVVMNESASKSIVEKPTIKTNEPETARKEDGAPIIRDWGNSHRRLKEDVVDLMDRIRGYTQRKELIYDEGFFLPVCYKLEKQLEGGDLGLERSLQLWQLLVIEDSRFALETRMYTDRLEKALVIGGRMLARLHGAVGSRCRLISWHSKKLTVVANSTTEAEYIAASICSDYTTNGDLNGMKKCYDVNQVRVVGITFLSKESLYGIKLMDGNLLFGMKIGVNAVKGMLPGITYYCWATVGSVNAVRLNLVLLVQVNAVEELEGKTSEDINLVVYEKLVLMITENVASIPTHSNDPLLSGEDRLKLTELMELCTKLSERVLALETTKINQALEIDSLKRRLKKLEKKKGSRTHRLKRLYKVGRSARVVFSKDEGLGDQEDASKQGRKIDEIDQDVEVTLVDETQGRYGDNLMFDTGVLDNEQDMAEKEVDMAEKDVSTADPVTTAGEVVTTANVIVSTTEVTTDNTTTTTVDELTLAQTLHQNQAD
ncbi:hypothetical protein Tco_0186276 [Tanacetum coccineum]